jgi:hypothetical protein
LGELQDTQVTLTNIFYFKLLLDMNQPDGMKSLISLASVPDNRVLCSRLHDAALTPVAGPAGDHDVVWSGPVWQ